MKRYAVILALVLAGCASVQPVDEGGWITLLDGSNTATIENWSRIGNANWRFVDGALVADKGTGNNDLVSKGSYANFELRVEFWAEPTTNSAVHIRAQDPKDITDVNSYEVNIFDARPDPSFGTGAIVHVAKVPPIYKAAGRWNTYVITAQGPRLTVELNGVQTVSAEDGKFSAGRIALQYAPPGGAIKFRKVTIRPL